MLLPRLAARSVKVVAQGYKRPKRRGLRCAMAATHWYGTAAWQYVDPSTLSPLASLKRLMVVRDRWLELLVAAAASQGPWSVAAASQRPWIASGKDVEHDGCIMWLLLCMVVTGVTIGEAGL